MTNLIPKEKEKLIRIAIKDTMSKVKNIKIDSPESMQYAANVLGEVKVRLRRLDDLKKELTKPFSDAVKSANNWFKTQQEPFKAMEIKLKTVMTVYIDAEAKKESVIQAKIDARRKKEEEAQAKKVAKAKEAGKPEPEALPEVMPVEVKKTSLQTEHGKVVAKKIWTYDIVEPLKVPRDFLTFDRAKITHAVRNGERKIPGVKIYQKTSLSA